MSTAAVAPPRARVWVRALRLYSITASIVPVVFGAVLGIVARDGKGPWLVLPALLGGVLLHLGTNLVNDYGDYKKGVDHRDALGGSGVLTEGLLTSREVATAAALCFGLASLIGVLLIVERGLPMAALGVLGLVGGWGYTAGPRYKYLGLGDAFVFLLMGTLMVLGGYVAMTGAITALPMWASVPVGLLVTAILHANNVRDLEADRETGVRTVANLIGRRASLGFFRALVFGAYVSTAALCIFRLLPLTAAAVALSLPLALSVVRALSQAETVEQRKAAPLVERTAQLHFVFGLLLIVGTALGVWLR